ncbi:MAG: aldo/keto reductase [Proteobacteria bacterium]|nr:aldo/keto reductase [Pseudomonadota bacterium]
MKSIKLGNTIIEANRVGLGAMPLSLENRPDEMAAMEVIRTFIEGGGNFIDTANVYCIDDTDVGHNEKLIAKTLNCLNNTTNIIVATKGGLRRPKGAWTVDASPSWLRQSCDKSLVDLDCDSIFLYQLHAPDPDIPITESIVELAQLKEEGKILHIGLSNVDVEQIKLALSVTDIVSVQNRCNLFEKKSFENGVVEFCELNEITFIAHSPVGGHFQHQQRNQNLLLNKTAEKYQASTYQIMLAWLLNKSPNILVIPGASKITSITDSLKAENLEISETDMQLLGRI